MNDRSYTEAIGAHVVRLRKRRGVTLTSLSEISRVSKAAISALENGRGNPTIEVLWKHRRCAGR